ncbi:MAG: acyl-[acyl-carrier-protein] thioesterase [Muribaculaceae bacterium]|nr:acyl-[acyl-carrier-protein] thioesterase [Muribaculaceae bacterium]
MILNKEYTHRYTLTAAQCNAQGELAPAQLVQHIIEVATEHADELGVGFERLARDGNLWVLSRIAIEMDRYPRLFEEYALTTWIEGYNRHFSERNFAVTGPGGEVLGYARTIWVAINMESRRPADLSSIEYIRETVSPRECPMAKQGKIRAIDPPQIVHDYRFRVSDIDVNRHVNSARYVELILNQMDLADYDECMLRRFEIEYRREAHYDDTVEVCSAMGPDGLVTAIMLGDEAVCLSRAVMLPR